MAKKAKPKAGKTNKKKSTQQDWPQKRNLFFRPERMKYVRKLIKDSGCVFCKSAQEKISLETLCVFKSKHSQIVLNKYPYNNGHLLVLPLKHVSAILDLSSEEYTDLSQTLRLAIEAVEKVYEPNGFNIGMNHGATGGAGIPNHIHYHVVPRWNGDLNFFPLIAETKMVVETLETSYLRYIDFFKSIKAAK